MTKICSVWAGGDFNAKECLGYKFSHSIQKFGYRIEQHYPSLLPISGLPAGDLVISNGFRSHIVPISKEMKRVRGADTIVYDLGYMHRSSSDDFTGYYQVGLNRIGWVPSFECPSDRFDNLGIEVKATTDSGSDKVLICAQKFKDAQHNLDEAQMRSLMKRLCREYSEKGYHVIFRSHPKSPFEIDGVESSSLSMQEELERVRLLVTYNSTSGVEAILAGVPAVCLDPNAHWYEVSSKETGGSRDELTMPSEEEVRAYLHRLAYSQWTIDEIAEGYPLNFILKTIAGEDPFDGTNYTACQEDKRSDKIALKKAIASKLDIDGLPWKEARALVRDHTYIWPKNKEHMMELVEAYNGKGD